MAGTLLSTKHLGVVCAVSGDAPLNQDEWSNFLTHLRMVVGAEVRVVFRTGEAAPDSRKRRDLFDITQNSSVQFAIMTQSKSAASEWTAAEWMGSIEVRTFAPDDFESALDFLDVADAFYPGLERKIRSMVEQLHTHATDQGDSRVRAKGDEQNAGLNVERRLADDLA